MGIEVNWGWQWVISDTHPSLCLKQICIYQTLSGIRQSRALFTCPACDSCDPLHCPLPWSPANCDSVSGKLFISSLLWELRKAKSWDTPTNICRQTETAGLSYTISKYWFWFSERCALHVMSCDILTTLTRKKTRMWGNKVRIWKYLAFSKFLN